MEKLNILITGCGGDIGQSINKVLKNYTLVSKVYGADMHNNHPGDLIFDKSFVVQPVSSPGYLDDILEIIEKCKINIVIPASEPELRYFCEIDKNKIGDVPLIMANQLSLINGFDKLKTIEFLKMNSLLFPKTYMLGDIKNPFIPSIIKSRAGSGSKTIMKINNEEDFYFYQKKYPEFICQEYLEPENEEYTCGLFRSVTADTRCIILKRSLVGGLSGFGETIHNNDIQQLLIKVAEKLDLVGSINIQLRLTKNGPFIFEINPRFSSTVYFRHLMGFSDVIWSIEEKLDTKISDYKETRSGIKFYRGSYEYINFNHE